MKRFDLGKVLGVPCMLNVVHEDKNGRTYANIGGVMALPKGMQCPPAINPLVEYSLEHHDEATFQSFPDFIKDRIKQSREWKALAAVEHGDGGVPDDASPFNEGDDTDLPF